MARTFGRLGRLLLCRRLAGMGIGAFGGLISAGLGGSRRRVVEVRD